MMILLEDYEVIGYSIKQEKGSRIILYNKQDLEQLLDTFRVTPYLDLLSDKILLLGRNEMDYIIKAGTILQ